MKRVRITLEPENDRGGKRNGAGRPFGALGKRAQALADRQSRLTGKMPHELLLEWAQTGVMEQVQTMEKKGKLVPVRDADGAFVKQEFVLDPYMRLDAAKAAANYYAPRLSSTVLTGKDGGPMELETIERSARTYILEKLAGIVARQTSLSDTANASQAELLAITYTKH